MKIMVAHGAGTYGTQIGFTASLAVGPATLLLKSNAGTFGRINTHSQNGLCSDYAVYPREESRVNRCYQINFLL